MAYSEEVRLGIVLYGGVSLAVYENGVAQELFRAVHGEGIYGLVKDLTGSDIIVDIVSGTSAGGVNGIFLGYALANGLNFRAMSDLWRNEGDIRTLLRKTNDPETASVLDSGVYQAALHAAFTGMPRYQEPAGSCPSPIEELDLFITGTDVAGDVSTVYDETGHAIDVKRHNAFFQLCWRQPRKNDFDQAHAEELATLARLTSCFPVAFAPVGINVHEAPNLAKWGRLRRSAAPAPAAGAKPVELYDRVFLDGGILNNKPFTYTIDAISRRTANRPVERFLFYVEPDPERFKDRGKIAAPGVLSAGIDALIAIPGYQSIGNDLANINAYNDQVNRINLLIQAAQTRAGVAATGGLLNAPVIDREAQDDAVYMAARLTQLRDRAVEGILNHAGRRDYFEQPETRRAGRVLIESFRHWSMAGGAAAALENLDVYFRFRRLQQVTYALYDPPDATPLGADYTALWESLNHQFKLIEIVQWAMEWYVDNLHIEWKPLASQDPGAAIAERMWNTVARGLRLVLDSGGVRLPEAETKEARLEFYGQLKQRVETLAAKTPTDNDAPSGGNLLMELDRLLLAVLSKRAMTDRVVSACQSFLAVDRRVFPMQFASGVFTRDLIRVERLSPIDATYGYSKYLCLEQKVAGAALGAFAGFFRKQWRANDIMWGRLDAVSQIIECILTQQRVRAAAPPAGITNPAALEARLRAMFPYTASNEPLTLARLLADIPRMSALPDNEYRDIVDRLVLAAQKEILSQEWKQVVTSAICQERDDSTYRARKSRVSGPVYDSDGLYWIDPQTSPDRILVEIAATTLAPDFPDYTTYRPPKRDVLTDLPGPVQVELGSRALMRLEKSVLACAPKLAAIPLLHKSVFGMLLPGLHGWSTLYRSRPEWRAASSAALLSVSLVVVALTVFLFGAPASLAAKLALLSSAAAVIVAWVWFFRVPHRTVVRTVLSGLLALVLAVLTFALTLWLVPLLQHAYAHLVGG